MFRILIVKISLTGKIIEILSETSCYPRSLFFLSVISFSNGLISYDKLIVSFESLQKGFESSQACHERIRESGSKSFDVSFQSFSLAFFSSSLLLLCDIRRSIFILSYDKSTLWVAMFESVFVTKWENNFHHVVPVIRSDKNHLFMLLNKLMRRVVNTTYIITI